MSKSFWMGKWSGFKQAALLIPTALLLVVGCKDSPPATTASAPPPPPPIVPVAATPTTGSPAGSGATSAAAPTVPPAGSVLRPEPIKGVTEYGAKRGSYQLDANDTKGIADAIENMNWHVDNFWSQFNRGPASIDELKKWDFPMYLKGWPNPPPGKKWALSGNAAQVRLDNEK